MKLFIELLAAKNSGTKYTCWATAM